MRPIRQTQGETFVDESEHAGTSWRAANWVRVGETAGRGRQDRSYAVAETRKAVYMYALEPAWRERLAVPAPALVPLAPGGGLDAESWAQNEFGGAPLGDARLSARLVASARLLAQAPLRAITGAAKGVRALVKGHYRLIDQPADSAVTVENILRPHRQRTLRRMGAHEMVLCIQDTTLMNFTRRGQTPGLAAIGSNQTGAVARGLHLHTTLAVNPEGVPLGVLRAGFDAPQPADQEAPGEPQSNAPKAREERKSYRWIEGLHDCAQAAAQLPDTRVLCTLDREADFVDLFVERREHAPQVELLVRAKVDRVLAKERTAAGDQVTHRLFDEVRSGPARGTCRPEGQQTGAQKDACGAHCRHDAALPAGGAAVPRGGAGADVGRPRARRAPAGGGRTAAVVPAEHPAGGQRRRRPADPALVHPALADRGLLPGPEVRLQGGGIAASHG